MNLALAIGGCTLDELDERMTEAEFGLWWMFDSKFHLPSRRSELYAAQSSLVAARVGGAKDVSINDFLFDPPAEINPVEQLKAAKEAFGFSPRKKRGE